MLQGVNYLELYGNDPTAIEIAYAIYINVLELDEHGTVLNAKYAEKRATQFIRSHCDPGYVVEPPFEEWETMLHGAPPLKDLI